MFDTVIYLRVQLWQLSYTYFLNYKLNSSSLSISLVHDGLTYSSYQLHILLWRASIKPQKYCCNRYFCSRMQKYILSEFNYSFLQQYYLVTVVSLLQLVQPTMQRMIL